VELELSQGSTQEQCEPTTNIKLDINSEEEDHMTDANGFSLARLTGTTRHPPDVPVELGAASRKAERKKGPT
jgi:hypothetical protein